MPYEFDEKGRRKGGGDEEGDARGGDQERGGGGEDKTPYMLFDFRKGKGGFPKGCEVVDPKRGDELLQKKTASAEKNAKQNAKKSEGEGEAKGEGGGGGGGGDGDGPAMVGPLPMPSFGGGGGIEDDEEFKDDYVLDPSTEFEVLKDGSTALIVKAGHRLRLNLSKILEGGDAAAAKKKPKKKKTGVRYAGFGSVRAFACVLK